jgi:protein SCO1/2
VLLLTLIGIGVGKMLLPKPLAKASPPPELYQTATLTLTDQDGKSFSTDSLRGHVWVADFIFTSCPGSCPMMSHQMAELQKNTPADVGFVSFTVDPKIDTPAVLKEYGQNLHADFSRWHFLTGTDQQMKDAALGMKIAVQPAQGKFALAHSDRFLLVDATGHVVGIFDGTKPDDVSRLIAEATKLASGGNAS